MRFLRGDRSPASLVRGGPALLDIRLALVLLPPGYSLARETYQSFIAWTWPQNASCTSNAFRGSKAVVGSRIELAVRHWEWQRLGMARKIGAELMRRARRIPGYFPVHSLSDYESPVFHAGLASIFFFREKIPCSFR